MESLHIILMKLILQVKDKNHHKTILDILEEFIKIVNLLNSFILEIITITQKRNSLLVDSINNM